MNSILGWMIRPFQRYADFSGRSCRTEYWLFQLNYFVVMLLFFLCGLAGFTDIGSTILFVAVIVLIIPSLAVQVRRLHDQDKLICPLQSGPKSMLFWTRKGMKNAIQKTHAGGDYRQAA